MCVTMMPVMAVYRCSDVCSCVNALIVCCKYSDVSHASSSAYISSSCSFFYLLLAIKSTFTIISSMDSGLGLYPKFCRNYVAYNVSGSLYAATLNSGERYNLFDLQQD